MGIKGQVHVVENNVWLYQEYDGYNLLDYVQKALSRGRSCWNEPEFLTRIIFTDMIRKNLDGTVDYGIGTARAPSI